MSHEKQIDDLHEALASTEAELGDAREALARVEADREFLNGHSEQMRLHAAKLQAELDTAQAKLADVLYILDQHRAWTGMGWEQLPLPVHAVEKIRSKLAQAVQQEAQGAQAGDDVIKLFERIISQSPADLDKATEDNPWYQVMASEVRAFAAALATQPAAGEPEQQAATNADDLPTKKYPLGAFDFDAPVAAGEPLLWQVRHCDSDHGWGDWEEVVPRSPALGQTVEHRLQEYRELIGRGYRYELRALGIVAPPAAAPVAAGEPVAFVDPADLDRLKAVSSVDARLYRSGSALAPPAAAHGDEEVQFELADVLAVRREDLLAMSGDVCPSTGRSEMECLLAQWLEGHDIPLFRKRLYAMRAQAGEGGEV